MTFGVFNQAAFKTASGVPALAPLASVEVRREDDNTLASIFADVNGATPLGNPFAADAQGRFSLYAAGLALGYKVTVTSGAEVAILRNVPIGTLMYLDAGTFALATDLIAKADVASPVLTGNPTAPTPSPGDNDTSIATTAFVAAAIAASGGGLPAKYIYGFTYANNATDAVNDIDIAAGGCVDDAGTYPIIGAALTKQSDVAWAVGNNAGMLDTGTVGNSDYYLWAIARTDTGVKDYLCSLSPTAPTMPASYTKKRLIGWFKRVGGTIVAFKTYETEGGGLELAWTTPTADVSLSNVLTVSRRTDAVKVPLTFSVIALLRIAVFDASVGFQAIFCSPDESDVAPSSGAAPLCAVSSAAGSSSLAALEIRTGPTGLIAARVNNAATVDTYVVVTRGFRWARRN